MTSCTCNCFLNAEDAEAINGDCFSKDFRR